MRIALIISSIVHHKKESLAITTLNFAKELVGNNNNVSIISRNKWNEKSFEVLEGISFFRTKEIARFAIYNKLLSFPFGIKKMKKKMGEVDILHGFSASPILVLRSILSKLLFCPEAKIVHTLKSYPIKKNVAQKSGSFILSRLGDTSYRLLNFADVITVPTKEYAIKICKKGVKKEKMKIIHSHIDLNKFKYVDKEVAKKKIELSKKIVLNYGAMWEIKGTDYLIKSIPLVIKNNPTTLFVFIPRNVNQAKEKYLPLIKELGIEKNVMIIEQDVNIETYVSAADVVVLPYPHLEGTEGNPSCIIESLACGTPVISSNLPEIVEVFRKVTILTPPKSVPKLAKAISYVLENDLSNKKQMMISKSKEFSTPNITKKFQQIYNQILIPSN